MDDHDDEYDQKFAEMQKYIPFLEAMIERLLNVKDKSREVQLQKMQSLHGILFNSKRKLKIETLQRCENVLQKLYNRVEKGNAPGLQLSIEQDDKSTQPSTSSEDARLIQTMKAAEESPLSEETPASPDPSVSPDLECQILPIIIPTERSADFSEEKNNTQQVSNSNSAITAITKSTKNVTISDSNFSDEVTFSEWDMLEESQKQNMKTRNDRQSLATKHNVASAAKLVSSNLPQKVNDDRSYSLNLQTVPVPLLCGSKRLSSVLEKKSSLEIKTTNSSQPESPKNVPDVRLKSPDPEVIFLKPKVTSPRSKDSHGVKTPTKPPIPLLVSPPPISTEPPLSMEDLAELLNDEENSEKNSEKTEENTAARCSKDLSVQETSPAKNSKKAASKSFVLHSDPSRNSEKQWEEVDKHIVKLTNRKCMLNTVTNSSGAKIESSKSNEIKGPLHQGPNDLRLPQASCTASKFEPRYADNYERHPRQRDIYGYENAKDKSILFDSMACRMPDPKISQMSHHSSVNSKDERNVPYPRRSNIQLESWKDMTSSRQENEFIIEGTDYYNMYVNKSHWSPLQTSPNSDHQFGNVRKPQPLFSGRPNSSMQPMQHQYPHSMGMFMSGKHVDPQHVPDPQHRSSQFPSNMPGGPRPLLNPVRPDMGHLTRLENIREDITPLMSSSFLIESPYRGFPMNQNYLLVGSANRVNEAAYNNDLITCGLGIMDSSAGASYSRTAPWPRERDRCIRGRGREGYFNERSRSEIRSNFNRDLRRSDWPRDSHLDRENPSRFNRDSRNVSERDPRFRMECNATIPSQAKESGSARDPRLAKDKHISPSKVKDAALSERDPRKRSTPPKTEKKTKNNKEKSKLKSPEKRVDSVENNCKEKPAADKLTKIDKMQSPLQSLYGVIDTKSGHSSGLQKFKIPKIKRSKPTSPLPSSTTSHVTDNTKEADSVPFKSPAKSVNKKGNSNVENSDKDVIAEVSSTSGNNITDISNAQSLAHLKQNDAIKEDIISSLIKKTKESEEKTDKADYSTANNSRSEEVSKKDPKDGLEGDGIKAKEEVTQKWIEALIRKSLENSEGKELVEHAKLIRKLGEALKAKKLKKIKRIIESESESSSSDENETIEQKKMRTKKKRRVIMSDSSDESSAERHDISSTDTNDKRIEPASVTSTDIIDFTKCTEDKVDVTSNNSSEVSTKNVTAKKNDRSLQSRNGKVQVRDRKKKKDTRFEKSDVSTEHCNIDSNKKNNIRLENNHEKENDRLENSNENNSVRLESDKPIDNQLEDGKEEQPKTNVDGDFTEKLQNTEKSDQDKDQVDNAVPAAELDVAEERANESTSDKPKARTKRRNSLEMLQEDIRDMFISEGVVSATGYRMCRLSKESQSSSVGTSTTTSTNSKKSEVFVTLEKMSNITQPVAESNMEASESSNVKSKKPSKSRNSRESSKSKTKDKKSVQRTKRKQRGKESVPSSDSEEDQPLALRAEWKINNTNNSTPNQERENVNSEEFNDMLLKDKNNIKSSRVLVEKTDFSKLEPSKLMFDSSSDESFSIDVSELAATVGISLWPDKHSDQDSVDTVTSSKAPQKNVKSTTKRNSRLKKNTSLLTDDKSEEEISLTDEESVISDISLSSNATIMKKRNIGTIRTIAKEELLSNILIGLASPRTENNELLTDKGDEADVDEDVNDSSLTETNVKKSSVQKKKKKKSNWQMGILSKKKKKKKITSVATSKIEQIEHEETSTETNISMNINIEGDLSILTDDNITMTKVTEETGETQLSDNADSNSTAKHDEIVKQLIKTDNTNITTDITTLTNLSASPESSSAVQKTSLNESFSETDTLALEIKTNEMKSSEDEQSIDVKMLQSVSEDRSSTIMYDEHMEKVFGRVNLKELIDYAWTGQEKYKCLICFFTTKNIVHHYKICHSNNEILIARLNPESAEAAITGAESSMTTTTEETNTNQVSNIYRCRFCCYVTEGAANVALEAFYEHCTTHTGEYRYHCKCCPYQAVAKASMRTHYYKMCRKFNNTFKECVNEESIPEENGMYGYLCRKCNYVQLKRENVELHAKFWHRDETDTEIVKINMSAAITETATIDNENSQKCSVDAQTPFPETIKSEVKPQVSELEIKSIDVLEDVSMDMKTESAQTFQANTDIVKTTESQRKNSDISEEHDDSRETATEKDTIVKVTEESNEMLKLSPGEPEGSVSSGNLSVFVCPPELENKEVEIQLERKKKMQEIAYNIGININKNFTKSGLSIIDKLQDKMRTDTVVSSVIKSDELTNAPQPRESSSMSVINPTTESVKLEENIGVSKDKLTDELMIEHENTSSRETLVDITLESVNSNTDKAEVKIRDPLVMDPSKNSESDDDVSDTETLRRSPVFESESSSEQSDSEPTDVNMILKETSSINASSLRDPMLTTIQRLAAQLQSTKPLEVSFTTDNVKFKNEFASPMASLPITSTPIILSRKQVNASPFGNAKQSSTKSDSDKYHEKTPLITCNDANPPTNFIRLRRLSGDMLSMTLPLSENPEDIRANTDRTQSDSTMDISQTDTEEECSFLKIENVVSLAPKSDSEVENPIVNDIRKAVEISPVKNKNMALNNNSPQALLLKMNVVKRLLKNNTNIQAVQPTTSAAMTLIPMKNMNKISNRPNILSKDTSKINIPVNKSSVNPDNTTKTVPASSSSTNTNCARMKMLRTSSSSTDTEQPNSLKVLKLKSTESYSAMMKATKLAHFYKCMAHDCVYTTDSVLLYYQHYHEHCEKSEKEHSTSPYDYQKCVYCYVTLNDWNSIRHHMWEEHGHCRYQCGYCFYRAVVPSYVLQHQICFHADSKYYLLTGKMGKAVPKQENIKRIEYVLPFVCVRDCGKFFYVIDTFVKHLTLKHKNYESTFQCHMCKCTLTSVELLLTHYKSHGLAKYQCIYCVYGSDDSTELHQHLSTYHFEQLPQIVERTLPPTPILNVEVIDQLVVRTFDDFGKLNDGTHAVRTEAASSKKVTTTNPLNVLMYPDPNNVEIALNQEQTNILNSVVPNLAEKIGLGSTEVTVSVFDVTLKNKKNALSGKTGEIDSKNTDKLTTIQKSEKQPSREEHLLNNVNEHKSFKQIEKEKPSNHATKQVLPEMDLELLSCMNTSSTEDSLKSFSDFNCSDEFVNTNLLDNIDFLKTLTKSNKTSFCKNDAVVPEDKMDDSDIEILENIVNEKVVDKKDVKDNGTKQKKDSLSFKQETEKKDLSTSDSNEKDLPTTCDTVGKDSSVICDTIEKDLSRTCDTVGKESSITCDTVEKDSSTMYDTVEKDLSTTCDADEKDLSTTCDTTEKESTSEETVVNATTKPLTLEDIKHTGYMGTDLYKCGNEQCNFAAQTAILLKSHIRECSFNTKNENFHCAHCKKRFIKVSFLLEHLKVHGLKRFGCSLCKKRYPVSYNATAHMKTKHKFPNTRLVPADPTNPSVDGLFIVQAICLKGNERRTKKRKGQKPTEQENENEKTVDKEKSSFNPNEIDQLPRQAIYFREVQCAVCPYTTKVRTNIVRHLQLHAKDETVPETGPVNPVPCLDKKERMFDKMVNLASSSHPNCRMGAKPKEVLKENDDDAFPKFVPEHKRYVCGVVECNYLTVHESMLRYHLKALHSEEPYFRCPHCPQPSPGQESQNIAIDKMGVHLKMHDTRLYKCSHCNHHHYQRHVVERHLADKHPEKKPFVKVIRELDNTENVQPQDETEEEVPDPNGNHWKCNICDFKCVYKAEMSSHALTAHDEKFQYKCSLCSFKTSARILFEQHISSKHAYDLNIDFVLVYQRIKGVNKRSSDTPEQSVQEEPFDTTPLWRRDMPRVRHIRGILLEEEQDEIPASEISSTSSKTSKRKHEAESTAKSAKAKIEKPAALEENKQPKEKSKKPLSCEKLSEEAEGDPQNVKKSTYKFESRDTTNKLATESTKTTELSEASDLDVGRFGPYGKPDGNMYICTLCNMFKTKYKFDMRYHLYKELKYARWHCKACGYLSVNRNSLLQHFTKCHNGERPNHEPLSPDNAIEEWVMTLLKKQTDMIKAATQQTNKVVTNKSVTTPVNVSAASPGVINAEKMSETRAVDLAPAITTLQTDILRDANRSIDTDDGDSKDNEDLVIDMREDEVLESSNIENISESDKTSEKDEPKVLICKHCHMKFTRIRGIKKHIQLTHLKRLTFLCPYCDRSSNLESLVLQHIRSKHPGCAEHIVHNPAVGGPELTNEFWEKEYGLVSPREKKTTKKKRKLNKSGESDDSKNSNNRAQEMCEVCGFLAVNYTGLKAHMRSHMPKHSIKCVYCTYTSSIRAKLIEHWEINHPSLPFQIKTISEIDPLVKTNDKKLPQNDKLKTPQNKLPQNDQKLSVNKKRSLDTSSDSIENECADSVDGAPSTTVTLYSCCYCNFHRRSLVFIKRHWNLVHKETKSVENGSNAPATVTNLPFRYQELIVPRSKLTQSENETKKKKKIELPRTFTSEQMEEYLARSRESLDTTNDEGSVCQWCQEFCKTDDMEMHHTIFHSHLPLNFKTLKQQSRDQPKWYVCSVCAYDTTSIASIRKHVVKHVELLKCKYCNETFSIPERVSTHCAEKHPGLPTKIDSISNFHSIVDDLVKKAERYNQIDGNGDCDDKGNGSNKGNGDSKGDGTGSGVMLKSETSQFLARSTNPPAVTYAVARKSTTKSVRSYVRPGPRRFRAVALKSTNPLPRYLRETMKYKVKQQQGTAMKMESDEVNRKPPWSFYRVPKDPINLAKLNTYMVVGGHSMRVNCSTLAQLININPKVILKDITYNPKNTANLSE